MLLSDPSDLFVGSYVTFLYFGVLAFYWTPIFQDSLKINGRFLNILIYLFQWVPFFGNIGLLVLRLSKNDNQATSSTSKSKSKDIKDRYISDNISKEEVSGSKRENKEFSAPESKKENRDPKTSESLNRTSGNREDKEKLLGRLQRELEQKRYNEDLLKQAFDNLDADNLDKSKIKTALHLTANNAQIKRILLCLKSRNLKKQKINSLSNQLEEERFYSKTSDNTDVQMPEDIQDISREDFMGLIKNFHKRKGRDARIFEKIGRRMIITDDYEPKKVFRALDQAYELRRQKRDNLDRNEYRDKREDLRNVAEESKEDDLALTIRKLENLLEGDIDIDFEEETDLEDLEEDEKTETENQEESEEEESMEQKNTVDNYVDRINSFHNQGGYRYRLLERIGRRLLNQDSSAEEVYSLISEFSESDRFREMSLDELEQIATEANEKNISDIEDELT